MSKDNDDNNADDGPQDELAAIVRKKNPDGTNRYTFEEVKHWIPLLILAMPQEPGGPDPDSAALFSEFVEKVRASDGATGPITLERIHRYYERYPVNAELQADLDKLVHRLTLEGQEDIRERLAGLVGAGSSAFEERKPPAEGQVRAGPLARFQASTLKRRQ